MALYQGNSNGTLDLVSGRTADEYTKAETDAKINSAILPITNELSNLNTNFSTIKTNNGKYSSSANTSVYPTLASELDNGTYLVTASASAWATTITIKVGNITATSYDPTNRALASLTTVVKVINGTISAEICTYKDQTSQDWYFSAIKLTD